MKIAYLTSLYPAVSHTFVLREVLSLRARGHEIATFSIRKAKDHDVKGQLAESEAAQTRSLVPANAASYAKAFAWFARRRRFVEVLGFAQSGSDMSLRDRLMWMIYFAEAVQLAHWLVRERFEILHCHLSNAGSNTGMLAAALAGIPFSLTCHGLDMHEPHRFRLATKVERAAFVVCVSEYGKALLKQTTSPAHGSKLQVVRCGLDKIEASPMPVHEGPRRLLCVARLSPEKNHELLLLALSKLKQRGQAFQCTLVGDGPLRSVIEKRIAQLGLSAEVTLTGSLAPEYVAKHYMACDMVVLASSVEGVPVALMEAMAHGRPVVATRVGGVAELVAHERTGLVVTPGDASELAAALSTLLSDRTRAQRMGLAGHELVWQDFGAAQAAERLETLFVGTLRSNEWTRVPTPDAHKEDQHTVSSLEQA